MKFFTLTDEQMIAHKPSCSFCGTRDCVTVRASVPLSEHAACTSPYITFLCHACANSALFSLAQVLGLRAEFEKLQANYKDACASEVENAGGYMPIAQTANAAAYRDGTARCSRCSRLESRVEFLERLLDIVDLDLSRARTEIKKR